MWLNIHTIMALNIYIVAFDYADRDKPKNGDVNSCSFG